MSPESNRQKADLIVEYYEKLPEKMKLEIERKTIWIHQLKPKSRLAGESREASNVVAPRRWPPPSPHVTAMSPCRVKVKN